jgi:aminocarboxymuconate-semialdehyde decarboxylase
MVARDGQRSRIIDIHCHLGVAEAETMVGPHYPKDRPGPNDFMPPLTREVHLEQVKTIQQRLTMPEYRLQDMDRLGIDIQAISPSPIQYYYWAEAELGRAVTRMINDRIAEVVAGHPDRFVGMGTVPMQAPELAVAEMRRCVSELGMRGIEIATNVDGCDLSDPKFRPFFAAAEELDVLIFIHPHHFTHPERLTHHYFNNVIGNPLESTIAVSHLIFGGVLERYAGLKICVAHGGGYLAAYPGRMDHAFRARCDCREHISRPPTEYLKKLYFDTMVFEPDQLGFLVEKYGADHVVMGTDYPFDMGEPQPVALVEKVPSLSDADRQQILGGNAARLLKIEA